MPPDDHKGASYPQSAGTVEAPNALTTRLDIYRFDSLSKRIWVFAQMGLSHFFMRSDGLRFYKLLGSGTGEGFHPSPNWGTYAILTVWDDETAARRANTGHTVIRGWSAHSDGHRCFLMRTTKAKGRWGNIAPFMRSDGSAGEKAAHKLGKTGPQAPSLDTDNAANKSIAVLTRATLKPSILRPFWRRVPDISQQIAGNPEVSFKIGIGEIPWLHQVTFSIWNNDAAIRRFAYQSGAHADAIRAAEAGDWFKDELFARFKILSDDEIKS